MGIEKGELPCSLSSILPAIGLICTPVILLCGYNIVTDYLVTEHDEKASRDPETGILVGAESLNLGPVDSPGAVLMVHGFLGAGNNFHYLPERLAEAGWRVRVMRLPGHGTIPCDLQSETADSMIQAVREELIDLRKSHKTVVLVGHSMGGTICTLVAAENKVDRLVLCAPYFGVSYKWYYLLRPETWTRITHPVLRWVYKGDTFIKVNRTEVKGDIISYRWVPMQGITILTELGRRASSHDILGRITCSVLLLHSRGDEAASCKFSETAFNKLKSSDKYAVWLTRSNHHILWDYEHETVIAEIVRFLGKCKE